MPSKIGIVLALDGEKEFTQGMKAAQQSAKLFDQELKNLDDKYQGNANSIEALTAKQEQLVNKQKAYNRELESAKSGQKNAVDNYQKAGERLEDLKDALDKAKRSMKDMEDSGDRSSQAYKEQARNVEQLEKAVARQAEEQAKASTNITKWDTAVAKAQGDVNKANAAVEKNAKYVDEAANAADGCATSIDKMGREAADAAGETDKLSVSLGDMIKAKAVDLAGDAVRELGEKAIEAAKYVVEVGSAFEASMSKVEALSGASGAELEAMSNKAKELGSTTRFSATEVADGFSYMALAGWDANESIAAIDGIVNLAAASQMDLAEASDMVTDYLSAFSMEASEAGHMADMMAYAQANSNTTTAQLGDAFGNCAANMNAAGQDMQTTTAFLEAFANQGIKGSEAGTKLSAIMRDITAKMQDGAIKIGDTSVAVTDANGNFRNLTDIMLDVEAATAGMGDAERAAALGATFTSRSVGGLNMILNEGVENIAGYRDQLNNCDGAAAAMAGTMQNNLSGALTSLGSASEGLGIALYDKVSGPLTSAVQTATNLINGITDAITPQQSALDDFLKEVQATGDAAQQHIDNANSSLDKGFAEVAKIDAMAGTIKAANDAFGIFAATDTSPVASNVGTTAASIKTNAASIKEAADKAKTALSMDGADSSGAASNFTSTKSTITSGAAEIKTAADKAKSALNMSGTDSSGAASSFSTTKTGIVSDAKAIETEADAAKSAINGIGDADPSGAGTKVGDLETSISSSKTGIETDANAIKDSISGIGEAELSGENLKAELQAIGDSMSTANQEMDEFTKFQVRAAVEELAVSIPAIGEAWDEVTGKLNMTEQEFNNLIDAQKRAVMESALLNAQSEAMQGVAEATIAQKMAQHELNAIYDEANRLLDEYDGTQKHSIDSTEELIAASGEYLVLGDLWETATGAIEEYNTESERLKGALETQDRVVKAADELAVTWGFVPKKEEEAAAAAEEAGEAFQELSEDEAAAAEAAYTTSQAIAQAHQAASDAIVSAYDQAKAAAESAFSINPFDAWAQNAENGLSAMQEAFDSQIEGMTNYAANLETISEHVGTDISPEFLGYLEDLGVGGAQVVQDLADAFESGDTSAVESLMQAYTDAMDVQDQITSAIALDKVALQLGMDELGSTASEWRGLEGAVDYISQFGSGLSEGTRTAFTEAAKTAQECGVKIPEGLQAGIEAGSENPEAAVMFAIEQINAAIEGQASGLLEAANKAGLEVPDAISEGIASGGESAVSAYNQLVELIASSGTGVMQESFGESGSEAASAMGESLSEGAGEVEAAAEGVAEAGASAASAGASSFFTAGTSAAAGFQAGLQVAHGDVNSAGQAMAQAGSEGAGSATGDYQSAGQESGSSFASGISSASGVANTAGVSVAMSGRSGAASVSGWDGVGAQMAAGVASGIRSAAASVAAEAAAMVRNAIAAAKAAASIASPSKKFRDEIGKQLAAGTAVGIKLGTKETTEAAEEQMNSNLRALQKWLTANKSAIQKTGTSYADAVAWSWKKLGDMQLDKGFGISEKDSKDKAKSASKYYSEVYKEAKKYFDNINEIYDVSEADARSYWKNVMAHMDKGTQAYSDAQKMMKKAGETAAKDVISDTNKIIDHMYVFEKETTKTIESEIEYWKKAVSSVKKNSDAWYDANEKLIASEKRLREKIVEDGEKYVDKQKERNKMSVAAEIEYWQAMLSELKKGSDEYKEVIEKIKDLKKEVGTVSNAGDLLGTYQTYYEMGAKAEMEYWDIIRRQYKAGTEERLKADKEYFAARKDYLKEREDLEKDHADKLKEINDDLQDAIMDAAKDMQKVFREMAGVEGDRILTEAQAIAMTTDRLNQELSDKIAGRLAKLVEDVNKRNEKLAADIKSRETKLAESIASKRESLAESIAEKEKKLQQDIAKQKKKLEDDLAKAKQKLDDDIAKEEKKLQKDISKEEEKLKSDIAKQEKKLNEDIAKAQQKLDENIASKKKKLAEDIAKAQQKLDENIASRKAKLEEDVLKRQQKLSEDINSTIEDRVKSIAGAFDLFDAFESESATGEELLFNLKAQAAGYKDWAAELKKLADRGMLGEDLMADITERGPSASAAVHALNMLSDKQLADYNRAYEEKMALAAQQARLDTKGEIRKLREEAAAEIADMRASTENEIKALKDENTKELKALKDASAKEIEELKAETKTAIADLKSASKTSIAELKTASKERIKELKDSSKANVKELKDSYKTTIADLKTSSKTTIAELKTGTKESIKELKDRTSKDIEKLKASTAKDIAGLKATADADIKELVKSSKEDIASMKAETKTAISDAKKTIRDAVTTYGKAVKDATDKANTEIAQLNDDYNKGMANLEKGISSDLKNLAENIKSVASDMTTALVAAFRSRDGLKDGAKSSVGTKAVTAAKAAGVTKSAPLAAAVGLAPNDQATKDKKATIREVITAQPSRSKTLTKAESSYNDLYKYIVTKYGRTPSTGLYKALADILGVKFDKNAKKLTDTQRTQILKALKAIGMKRGTRSLDDLYAWMDEEGVGSEMILRKSDGARLNTNVQKGDAIVPAANTDNLWEWSKLVPDQFLKVASAASMNSRVLPYADSVSGPAGMPALLSDMFRLMQQYMPYIAQQRTLSVDGRELATATADYTSNIFAMNSRRRRS